MKQEQIISISRLSVILNIDESNITFNDGKYDVIGDVNLNSINNHISEIVVNNKLIIKFGTVCGDFIISGLLNSLYGVPDYVYGSFKIISTSITTIDYFPIYIRFSIDLSSNYHLKELSFLLPEKVEGDFNVRFIKLESLKNCPSFIKGNFDCSYNKITTLEYGPTYVGGRYDCSNCDLTSLEYIAQNINHLDCSNNMITDLLHLPPNPFDCLRINRNKLTSLRCSPEYCEEFNCSHNPITNLNYAPKYTKLFDCSYTEIESLENSPIVCSRFIANNCRLNTLKGCTTKLYDLDVSSNDLDSLEYISKHITNNINLSINKIRYIKENELPFVNRHDTFATNLDYYGHKINISNNMIDFETSENIINRYKYTNCTFDFSNNNIKGDFILKSKYSQRYILNGNRINSIISEGDNIEVKKIYNNLNLNYIKVKKFEDKSVSLYKTSVNYFRKFNYETE